MSRSNRRMNQHHLLFENRDYAGIRKEFRNLDCFKVMLDVEAHALFHLIYSPPKRPDVETAMYFINRHKRRECACFNHAGEMVNVLEVGGELDVGERRSA
jgi:hypothetical protein